MIATLQLINELNADLGMVNAPNRFQTTTEGVLEAFIEPASYIHDSHIVDKALLIRIQENITQHLHHALEAEKDAVICLAIEIGTATVKLLGLVWTDITTTPKFTPLADVKFRLPPASKDLHNRLGMIVDIVEAVMPPTHKFRPVEAYRLDPANPSEIFADFAAPADFTFVYGTQGVRDIVRALPQTSLGYLRPLSADEEGLIAFRVGVAEARRTEPGTLFVEIGSGSTELVLIGADGKPYPLSFAIGGRTEQADLFNLRLSLNSGDPIRVPNIESPLHTAEAFFSAMAHLSRLGPDAPIGLCLNSNKDNEVFRKQIFTTASPEPVDYSPHLFIDYFSASPEDSFIPKAHILKAIIEAFNVESLSQGLRGGLKTGVSLVISDALSARFSMITA